MSEMALESVLAHPYYRDEAVCEQVADRCIDLDTLWAALPDESAELPPEGAWIMVREQPTTSIPDPPLYSMWRARPVYYSTTFKRVRAGGRSRTLSWPLLRARVRTPHGELTLLPREYVRVRDVRVWLDEVGKGVTLHVMGPGARGNSEFEQRVFYLQARGLSRAAVLELLLPEVADQEFAWLSLDGTGAESYVEIPTQERP